MVKKVSFLFFLFLLFAAQYSFSETMNLEQCIKTSIANNSGLKAAEMMEKSSESGIKVARADFLPSLNASASGKHLANIKASGTSDTDYIDQFSTNYHVQFSQGLFSGLKTLNAYEKAKLEKQMCAADKELKKIEVVYQTKVGFFELMKAVGEARILAKKIKSMDAGLSRAKAFYEKRFVPKADLLESMVDLENANLEKSIAENNVNRKKAELLLLMGMNADAAITFEKGSFDNQTQIIEQDFQSLFETAKKQRPDLISLAKQVAISDKNAAIEAGKYLPEIKFNAGYYDVDKDYDEKGVSGNTTYDRDQRNQYWSADITVQVPLFNGGRAYYRRSKYKRDAKRFEYLLNESKNKIKTGIKKALYSIEDSKYRIRSSKEAKKSAEEFAEMAKKRFEKGLSALTDLITAEEKLARAKSNFEFAQFDLKLALAELKFMTGQKQ